VLDSYCIPRDSKGQFPDSNFLATAPIVALNARGTGAHTALVSAFDCLIYAFDPMDLKRGPLYVVNPLPAGDKASVASDFLSITSGGTLIIQAWDDTDNEFSMFAVPGVLDKSLAPNQGGSRGGLSAGAAAGVTITVLLLVGVGVGAFIVNSGGVAAAMAKVGLGAYAPTSGSFLSKGFVTAYSYSAGSTTAPASEPATIGAVSSSSSGYSNI
jgi:hypothetical protein